VRGLRTSTKPQVPKKRSSLSIRFVKQLGMLAVEPGGVADLGLVRFAAACGRRDLGLNRSQPTFGSLVAVGTRAHLWGYGCGSVNTKILHAIANSPYKSVQISLIPQGYQKLRIRRLPQAHRFLPYTATSLSLCCGGTTCLFSISGVGGTRWMTRPCGAATTPALSRSSRSCSSRRKARSLPESLGSGLTTRKCLPSR